MKIDQGEKERLLSLLQSVRYPLHSAHRKIAELETLGEENAQRLIRTWELMASSGKSFGTAWSELQQIDRVKSRATETANESLANERQFVVTGAFTNRFSH